MALELLAVLVELGVGLEVAAAGEGGVALVAPEQQSTNQNHGSRSDLYGLSPL